MQPKTARSTSSVRDDESRTPSPAQSLRAIANRSCQATVVVIAGAESPILFSQPICYTAPALCPLTTTPRSDPMPTAKSGSKKSARHTEKTVPAAPLVLKRETVADLQAMLKQTTKVRQSKKVCIA